MRLFLFVKKIDAVPCFFHFHHEIRVVPSTNRFLCDKVQSAFTFRAVDWDGKVRFAGCAVHVRPARNEHPVLDRRPERFDDRWFGLGSLERVLVNIARFHRTEDNHHDESDECSEKDQDRKTTSRDEPFPVSCPPVASRLEWKRRRRFHYESPLIILLMGMMTLIGWVVSM